MVAELLSAFGKFTTWLKKIFWIRPTDLPKATEVESEYVVLDYKGHLVNLKKTEVIAFNAMSRKDKRAMALRFDKLVKDGKIRFETINGKLIAIKNKDYEAKSNIQQQRTDKTGSGKQPGKTQKRN
jgi:hypothetical protein